MWFESKSREPTTLRILKKKKTTHLKKSISHQIWLKSDRTPKFWTKRCGTVELSKIMNLMLTNQKDLSDILQDLNTCEISI